MLLIGKGHNIKYYPRLHGLRENLCDEILPNLWLGSIQALNLNQFDAVISVLKLSDLNQLGKYNITAKYWLKIPLEDKPDAPIERFFSVVVSFIEKHLKVGQKILLHCRSGHSRSASLLAWYLMQSQNLTCDQAFEFIKLKRPTVNPNAGFAAKLSIFLNTDEGFYR
jgi:protein-tyrosine phosphatase